MRVLAVRPAARLDKSGMKEQARGWNKVLVANSYCNENIRSLRSISPRLRFLIVSSRPPHQGSDTEFTPRTVNAVAGDTITFVLVPGAMGHNLQSVTIPAGAEPWDTPLDPTNPRFRIEVAVPGVYRHHCNVHLFMKGVIRVSE